MPRHAGTKGTFSLSKITRQRLTVSRGKSNSGIG
jgi:hypothetical protein